MNTTTKARYAIKFSDGTFAMNGNGVRTFKSAENAAKFLRGESNCKWYDEERKTRFSTATVVER